MVADAGIGLIAGIGFTVSLFIAELAFDSVELQGAAKVGILGASVVASALGLLVLQRAGRKPAAER